MTQPSATSHGPAERTAPVAELHFRKRLAMAVAGFFAAWAIRVMAPTLRLKTDGPRALPPRKSERGTLLFAIWHGDHFPAIWVFRNWGVHVITSQSADGQLLTNIIRRFGFRCIRGSSSRGGVRALIHLARAVQAGAHAMIAVDGPKGPRRRVKPGIVLLAKLTGRPIIPTAGACQRYWQARSWDQYRIPKPFSRVLMAAGDPIDVPPDADDAVIELKRLELERVLLKLQEQAEIDVAAW